MIMRFVDREREMALLQKEWENRPSFVVLYGKRRVGKTRLLQEFSKDKNPFFFTFSQTVKEIQIEEFKRELAKFLNDKWLERLKISDWKELFTYMADKLPEKSLIILDEFTYAIKSDRKILSDLQRVWDHELTRKDVMLIISGSLLGMMWDDVLGYASPLYGRRTRDIHLKELDYLNALKFFEDKEYGLKVHMLVGGTPTYLNVAKRYRTVEDLVKEEFLSDGGFFYNEPYILLSQELRELKMYFSILSAISYGNTRLEEIANFVGKPARSIYPYMENLIRLGFVEKETPVLGKKKRSVYKIRDNLLLSWFTLVYPNWGKIPIGVEIDKNALVALFSRKFEEVAKEFLILKRPFDFKEVGRWWFKGGEIDIIAIGESQVYLFEVKWSDLDEKKAEAVLRSLKKKARLLDFDGDFYYGIIAKSLKNKNDLREKGFYAFDSKDILAL